MAGSESLGARIGFALLMIGIALAIGVLLARGPSDGQMVSVSIALASPMLGPLVEVAQCLRRRGLRTQAGITIGGRSAAAALSLMGTLVVSDLRPRV